MVNQNLPKIKSWQSGFTLVELIIVMAIIGAIAGLLLVNFQNARVRSRDAVRKADLRSIKQALQLYYNDNQSFPASNSAGEILGCGSNSNTRCTTNFTGSGNVYMQSLPHDPVNSGVHVYDYSSTGGDSYELSVSLENGSDEDIAKSQARCGVTISGPVYITCPD